MRIDAVDVSVDVGRHHLLQNVSLTLLPGEFVGVLGPSGCGKSTLLKTLSGQLLPSKGTVLLNGRPPDILDAGFVPQDDIVHGSLRVERALVFSGRLRMPPGTPMAEVRTRVDEVIAMVELDERRATRIEKLSGGQRKRVSVAVELLTRPPLLFLDEPTSGLDPALEEHMMDLFASLARAGRTVVLTTHVTQNLDRLDLMVVLASGRVVFVGTPADALAHFGVSHLVELYRQLSGDAAQLSQRFISSPLYQQWVLARQPA